MRRLPFPGGSTSPSGVGHFRVPIQVGRRGGTRFSSLDALVDTGSTYTWIPRRLLEDLAVEPEQEWPFVLADGREVRYPTAWIQIRLEGREAPTLVVFAPEGSEPIVGAFTLQGFLLAADPVNERLIAVPGLAKRAVVERIGLDDEEGAAIARFGAVGLSELRPPDLAAPAPCSLATLTQ